MSEKQAYYPLVILGVAGVILLGYFTTQQEFWKIAWGYGMMWLLYGYVMWKGEDNPIRMMVVVGIGLRCLLLPTYPPLSDDYFRFIWDGFSNLDGVNPYQFKPEVFIEQAEREVYHSLFDELNSKIYYSVYPPLLQGVFTLGAWLFPNDLLGAVVVMRTSLILFEIGSIYFIIQLLQKFSFPQWQVLLYALNPLVIIEISGNLHFEGMMIFFLLGSIYVLVRFKSWAFSAVILGLSIGAKLLPLMLLPFFLHKLGLKKAILYGLLTGLVAFLCFFMLWDVEMLAHFRESINLYYKRFEFNGGIYYILREVGFWIRGYNEIATIGPGLALVAALGIIYMALRDKNQDLSRLPLLFLMALTLYQLCSTTVHPWYIAPLVAMASLTRMRFAIAWSGLILLTYINYSYESYFENIWVVVLEYGVVLGIMFFGRR